MSVLVETTGLRKQYLVGRQPIEALKDFSIRIERGEFVAIVGPSGSGKSTEDANISDYCRAGSPATGLPAMSHCSACSPGRSRHSWAT